MYLQGLMKNTWNHRENMLTHLSCHVVMYAPHVSHCTTRESSISYGVMKIHFIQRMSCIRSSNFIHIKVNMIDQQERAHNMPMCVCEH